MIGSPKDEALRLDTRYLRDLVLNLHNSRNISQQIYAQVNQMKNLDDETQYSQYRLILNKIDVLSHYLQSMEQLMDHAITDGIELSRNMFTKIQNDTENVNVTVSDKFIL